jgi:anti-sigma factor RsiW
MKKDAPIVPCRAEARAASFAFLFARQRYLDLALQHNLAINIEAPDMRKMFERGDYPQPDWEGQARATAASHAGQLGSGLWTSLITAAIFLLAGLVAAAMFGELAPDLSFAPAKFISTVGGFLAAWATLFELGGYAETMNGEALHEVVRPVLFKAIFLPGLAIAAVGQLW